MRTLDLEEELRDFVGLCIEWHTDNGDPEAYDYEDDGDVIKIVLHPPANEAGAQIGTGGKIIKSMGILANNLTMRRGRRVHFEIDPVPAKSRRRRSSKPVEETEEAEAAE